MHFVELAFIVFSKGLLGKLSLLEKIGAEHYLMDLMFNVGNNCGCPKCLLKARLQEAYIFIRSFHGD